MKTRKLLNPLNLLRMSAVTFCWLALINSAFSQQTPVKVTGANLAFVEKVVEGKLMGRFLQTGRGTWREESAIDEGRRDWKELRRDENSVTLQDAEELIRLDLKQQLAFYSTDNFKSEAAIYQLRNARGGDAPAATPAQAPGKVTGANLAFVEKVVEGKLMGRFVQTGRGTWREESAIDEGRRDWKELRRDENSVALQDGEELIRLDLKQQLAFYSTDNFKSEAAMYQLRNARGGDASATTPAQAPGKVTGVNLAFVEKVVEGKLMGRFVQTGRGTWREESAIDEGRRDWKELRRDENSVALQDGEESIRLDLKQQLAFYSTDNFKSEAAMYQLRNAKGATTTATATAPEGSPAATSPAARAAVTGTNLGLVEKVVDGKMVGRFRKAGEQTWREESAINDDRRDWKELRHDENSVSLQDGQEWIRLDLKQQLAFRSTNNFQSEETLYGLRNARGRVIAMSPKIRTYIDDPNLVPQFEKTSPSAPRSAPPVAAQQRAGDLSQSRTFAMAARAALKTVYTILNEQTIPSVNKLRIKDHPEFAELGLDPEGRVSFYRMYGPREITFFVASDETHLILAFRGTETHTNWYSNGLPFKDAKTPDGRPVMEQIGWGLAELDGLINGMPVQLPEYRNELVHKGWQANVDSIWPEIVQELQNHQAERKTVMVTGHSLGGALSGYATFRLLNETNFFDRNRPHLLATFAAPHYSLQTDNGAPALFAAEVLLSGSDFLQRIVNDFTQAIKLASQFRPEAAVNSLNRAFEDLQRLNYPIHQVVKSDFRASYQSLIATKAPSMKVYAVESYGPDGVDLVTVSWDLGGLARAAHDRLRGPFAEMHRVTNGIPLIPAVIDEIVGSAINMVSAVGQGGFGTAAAFGEVVSIKSPEKDIWDLHDYNKSYYDVLKNSNMLASTRSTSPTPAPAAPMPVPAAAARKERVMIKTADKQGAGTDSNIDLELWGMKEGEAAVSREKFRLNTLIQGNAFERNATDMAMLPVFDGFGKAIKIKVTSDGSNPGASWALEWIEIQGRRFDFNVELNGNSAIYDLRDSDPQPYIVGAPSPVPNAPQPAPRTAQQLQSESAPRPFTQPPAWLPGRSCPMYAQESAC